MKLIIANSTKQHFKFHYRPLEIREDIREDESGRPITLRKISSGHMRVQDIGPGEQICISGDLTQEEIDHIVAQYHPYGMKPASEIHGKGFTGLIYSIGRPVEVDGILFALEQNDGEMDRMAREQRELSAAAIAREMTKTMAKMGVDVQRIETVTAEDDGTGTGAAKNAEVYEMVKDGVQPRGGRRRTG